MGLVVSQARMLLLTSRKCETELNILAINNRKLLLAEPSENITTEYNKILKEKCISITDNTEISDEAKKLAYAETDQHLAQKEKEDKVSNTESKQQEKLVKTKMSLALEAYKAFN